MDRSPLLNDTEVHHLNANLEEVTDVPAQTNVTVKKKKKKKKKKPAQPNLNQNNEEMGGGLMGDAGADPMGDD